MDRGQEVELAAEVRAREEPGRSGFWQGGWRWVTAGSARLAESTRVAWQAVGDLWMPRTCVFCGEDLEESGTSDMGGPEGGRKGSVGAPEEGPGWRLCGTCQIRLRPRLGAACPRCAHPLPPAGRVQAAVHCPRCRTRKYAFTAALALGPYEGEFHEAVLRMKREVHEPLTMAMGDLLGYRCRQWLRDEVVDAVVPIPMHWSRRLRGGGDRCELLAERVARALGRPLRRGLVCCRRVKKQGTLLPGERFRNVQEAFRATRGYAWSGSRVLLVDDILTTGATANAAARALKQQGVATVRLAVVARALGAR